jgi:hypothetical protein
MTASFREENARQRERLRNLISRLKDQDLARPLEAGWTVAAALAHLAFWDYRALVLLKRWKQTGVQNSPIDADAVNDALLPLAMGLPPRKAAEIALEAASAIDKQIEILSPEFIAEIEAKAPTFRLNRAAHRQDHLTQMENALSEFALSGANKNVKA